MARSRSWWTSSVLKDFSLVKQVSRANLERDVRHLSTAWPTRHTFSRHHEAVSAYLRGRLATHCTEAHLETYIAQRRKRLNVVGVSSPPTTKLKQSTVLIGAHFDSRQEDLQNAEASAPGANDNGTGVAALLEVARLWKLYPGRKTDRVVFALFSGEEQGLWGSEAFVASRANTVSAIKWVFNLDQIGFPPQAGPKFHFLDIDEAGRKNNNGESARLIARLEDLAKNVVKVPTKRDPAEGSDYMPFEQRGVPIVGLYEGEYRYPHYHKSTDTYDKVDFGYVTDMTRLTLTFLIDQCGA